MAAIALTPPVDLSEADEAMARLLKAAEVDPAEPSQWVSADSIRAWFPDATVGPVVYFLASNDRQFVKVGTTKRLAARLTEYQIANPLPLELLGTVPGSFTEEREWHGRLAEYKHQGEWFHLVDPVYRMVMDALHNV